MNKVILIGVFTLGVVIGWNANIIKSKWTLGSSMYGNLYDDEL